MSYLHLKIVPTVITLIFLASFAWAGKSTAICSPPCSTYNICINGNCYDGRDIPDLKVNPYATRIRRPTVLGFVFIGISAIVAGAVYNEKKSPATIPLAIMQPAAASAIFFTVAFGRRAKAAAWRKALKNVYP
ncbi:MAG: hypothetical protein JW913_10475 [Chitinispirillaceae bacterium]|nr:hypothetical protein [Chitinispirillaceae bacterium]